jgi:hypothetical protein
MPINGRAKLLANERYRQAHKQDRADYMRQYMADRRRKAKAAKEEASGSALSTDELISIFNIFKEEFEKSASPTKRLASATAPAAQIR